MEPGDRTMDVSRRSRTGRTNSVAGRLAGGLELSYASRRPSDQGSNVSASLIALA
jgi:hypothetical protein